MRARAHSNPRSPRWPCAPTRTVTALYTRCVTHRAALMCRADVLPCWMCSASASLSTHPRQTRARCVHADSSHWIVCKPNANAARGCTVSAHTSQMGDADVDQLRLPRRLHGHDLHPALVPLDGLPVGAAGDVRAACIVAGRTGVLRRVGRRRRRRRRRRQRQRWRWRWHHGCRVPGGARVRGTSLRRRRLQLLRRYRLRRCVPDVRLLALLCDHDDHERRIRMPRINPPPFPSPPSPSHTHTHATHATHAYPDMRKKQTR